MTVNLQRAEELALEAQEISRDPLFRSACYAPEEQKARAALCSRQAAIYRELASMGLVGVDAEGGGSRGAKNILRAIREMKTEGGDAA